MAEHVATVFRRLPTALIIAMLAIMTVRVQMIFSVRPLANSSAAEVGYELLLAGVLTTFKWMHTDGEWIHQVHYAWVPWVPALLVLCIYAACLEAFTAQHMMTLEHVIAAFSAATAILIPAYFWFHACSCKQACPMPVDRKE